MRRSSIACHLVRESGQPEAIAHGTIGMSAPGLAHQLASASGFSPFDESIGTLVETLSACLLPSFPPATPQFYGAVMAA